MIKKPEKQVFRENQVISLARETGKQVEKARPALKRNAMAAFGMLFAPLILVPVFTWLNHRFPALLSFQGQTAIWIAMFVVIYFTFLRPYYRHDAERRRENVRSKFRHDIDEAAALRRDVFGDQ